MSEIDEARKRLRAYASNRKIPAQHDSDIRAVLDALDAAERERAVEGEKNLRHEARLMEERDGLAAIIERVRANLSNAPECAEHPDGDPITCGWKADMLHVRKALLESPDDALRAVKAEAWDEGAKASAENVARHIWGDGEPITNPYRETKEQNR